MKVLLSFAAILVLLLVVVVHLLGSQAKGYTELYFADAKHLPNVLLVNQTGEFAFVIHSAERTEKTYAFVAAVSYNNTSLEL